MSLDGFIGKEGKRIRFSNEHDKHRVHALRARSDGIMVGISTVLTDNPHLTVRHASGRNPVRIVVDSRARTPLDARVLDGSAPTIIAVSRRAPPSRRKRLQESACVITAGAKQVDLKSLMAALSGMGLKRILLEGGGKLNRSMLAQGLVDEIYLTITPLLLGDGIRWINGTLPGRLELSYAGCLRLGDQIVLHYKTK
jgi:2,5-diamino-6-(ribosylamino)-4(3H)-pyrimidinone 5'-phosphate reductase